MSKLIFGSVIPLFFLNQFEASTFTRVGRIESTREKFDTFTQALNYREPLMIHRAFDRLHHVSNLPGVGSSDESGPGSDKLFHGINWLIDCALGIGFRFETNRRGGRSLFLR